jgi:hypothetical protein
MRRNRRRNRAEHLRSAAIAGAATTDEVRIAGGVAGLRAAPRATTALATASFRDIVSLREMGDHPYRCIGRIEARPRSGGGWQHSGSGVLVGP